MKKNKKNDYSIIEGCIRQLQHMPVVKNENNMMWYVDHEMIMISNLKCDHDYINRKIEQQNGPDTTNN